MNIRRLLIVPAALMLGTLPWLAACRGAAPDGGAPAAAAAQPRSVVLDDAALANAGIAIAAVGTITRTDRLIAPGLIALDETRTARVGSLQEGVILEARAQVGDHVKTGQLLATMHGHAMHEAWAGYRKSVADRRRLEKELAYAVDAHERARRLYADKAVSLQEVQRAETDRVSAAQMLSMAEAEVGRAVEELEHVGVSVTSIQDDPLDPTDEATEQIPVRSPIGGVVLERLVTPGTTVLPGTPLFVVSELSTLWAIAEIDESRLSHVRTGRPVDVTVAAYPGERFHGTITFIADVVNAKTRRLTVRAAMPNADGRLKPEMFATVVLGDGEPRSVTVVPMAAVQTIDGRATVFAAESGSRFVPTPVTLGAEQDGLVEVTGGLAAGRRIAVSGSFALKSELLKGAAESGQ
jgi:cobalt-zinc-cadmium efflux system membrane fusion protein